MDTQKPAISEDLYNLTQLAEVSLAVGPINTSFKTEPHDQQNYSKNLSSSDEDSAGYYSHKLFDRKKVRRSYTSESNSSGNGSQSSSGDENSYEPKMRKNFEDEHVCPECGKKYSTSSNLARHRQTHRSIEDKKARRCPFCTKVYVSMPAYSMHVRTHNQGCVCKHCGKSFSRPWLLQGHIRTHTGEKPFKCTVCSKAFADKSNLRAHVQTHSNTKPHTCGRCGKAFALKSYLYKHEDSSCKNQIKQERERLKSNHVSLTKVNLSTKILQKEEYFHGEDQKSYTTLTPALSQEDFSSFSRVSVIRQPILPSPHPANPFHMNFYQDSPVDFSPKNNFTHSVKTSPFEVTSNYALVA